MDERRRLVLQRHLAALEDDARAMDATAALFRPELEACWEVAADGIVGRMLDAERALQLRTLVLDGEKNAKYNRELAETIRALLPQTP